MSTAIGSKESSTRGSGILLVARRIFLSYGFKRTSMMDIARAAELSRAGLYRYYSSKEELFREVVVDLHESLLAQAEAEAVRAQERGIEATLVSIFDAYIGEFVREYGGLPHNEELYEVGGRLCGDVLTKSRQRLLHSVANVLRQAARRGEIQVASASRAATLLHASVSGLKQLPPGKGGFSKDLRDLVNLFVQGLAVRSEKP